MAEVDVSMRLITDMKDVQVLPRNFRSLQAFKLAVSGSAQFSAKSLCAILEKIGYPPEKVVVIDLREESHGFINGDAVSWYLGYQNWGNFGAPLASILQEEQVALASVLLNEREWIYSSKSAVIPFPYKIERVETEAQLLADQGVHYFRLPVTDHMHPSDGTVDQFLTFLDHLPRDYWIHFHCKAGKGRTSVFMVLTDIYFNACRHSLDAILSRQKIIGGADVRDESDKEWKESLFKERLRFIQHFYQYIQYYPNHEMSWKEWVSQLSHKS